MTAPVVDGRRLRSQRTRAAVIDAMIALLSEQVGPLTSSAIAERAGVTQRTLFRHFSSLDDVYAELIAHQRAFVEPFVAPIERSGSIDVRLDRLVANRTRLFAAIAPVRRAALRVAGEQPMVADGLRLSTDVLRDQAAALFAPELAALRPAPRRVALGSLDTASSWEVWERLVTVEGLDEHSVAAAMRSLLRGAALALSERRPPASR